MASEPEPVEDDAPPGDEPEVELTDADVDEAALLWGELCDPEFRGLVEAEQAANES